MAASKRLEEGARELSPVASLAARSAAAYEPMPNGHEQADLGLPPGELLDIHRRMLLLRRLEERIGQLYAMGEIGGFCHLYIGQEAVAVGMERATRSDDPVITAYRCHAHMVVRGVAPELVIGELLGKADGVSGGKGGSMHMFDPARNFYGGHGIVGAQVPLGTGIAFALKYRKTDRVCVTYFGDGAISQGQVAEAFNMAALWKLPIVYVVENNQYGMGTAVDRASAVSDLHKRGESFGIPGQEVDGMDPVAVERAGMTALEHARSGRGPMLLEMKTYRYRGHSMSDPALYRTREEVQKVREERDPISRVADLLVNARVVDADQLKAVDREIRAMVMEAVTAAQAMPAADPAELMTDIYSAGS